MGLTPEQFAARIRERHPGAYDDISNYELATKVVTKYPEYRDMVNIPEIGSPIAEPEVPGLLSGEYQGPTGTVASGESLGHALTRQALGGVGRAAKALAGFGIPTTAGETAGFLIAGPLGSAAMQTGKAQAESAKRAFELAKQKRYIEAAGHGLAAATPLLGPMIAGATERAGAGTVGPAAELTTLAASGRFAKQATEGAIKGVAAVGRLTGKWTGAVVQDIAGAGKEPIAAAREAHAKRVQAMQTKQAEQIAKSKEQYQQETAASEQAGIRKDIENTAQYEKEVAETQAVHTEKVAKANVDWLQKVKEARGLKSEAAAVEARKQAVGIAQEEYLRLIGENVEKTHTATRASLSQRWDAFRDAVGRETKLNAGNVYNAVVEARNKYLKGSPASIKVFNELMDEVGVRRIVEIEETTPTKFQNLSKEVQDAIRGQVMELDLETARIHSSAIGERRYAGDLPGNVYQALKHVQDALETEIGSAAQAKGQGATYAKLKFDWSQYMRDWNDMRALNVGGSPLARVLRAKDSGFIANQLLGKSGDRLLETAGRYSRQGASTKMMMNYRKLQAELGTLPKIRVPAEPGKPVIPAPELPEAPGAVARTLPQRKEVLSPRLPEKVDPVQLRKELLRKRAGRPFGWWELFPPYLIEHLLLKSEMFREWVAKQPRREK